MVGFLVLIFVIIMALLSIDWGPTVPLDERLAAHQHSSDSNYLSQMPSDISDEVALGVRRIIAEVSGAEPDEVWPSTTMKDLNLE